MKYIKQIPKYIAYIAVALPLFGLSANAQEQLLLSERFTNNTGDGADLVDYGFNGLMFDPKHGDPTKPVDVSVDEGQVHATSTAVSPDVGVELTFDEADTGHVYMWTGGKETWYLLNTEAAAIDRSQMELSRVTWYHKRTDGQLADFDVRVVVEIDGIYYASDNYGETGEDVLEWKSKEYTFTTDGSAWRVLTANIAEDWNLAAETLDGPLPDGNIDSIGLYVRRGLGGGSVALDELEIYVSTSGNMETWAGYPVNANGDVNTGTWLGWLNVAHKPWILSYSMNQWLFIDESAVSDSGSWVYVINF